MAVKLQTTSYPIFSNLKITLGLLGGSKTESKNVSVVWGTGTTVTGARLVVSAQTDSWWTDMIVHFNGQQVYRRDWGTETGAVSESIDVGALLQNGVNSIAVTYEKPLGGANLTVSVSLQVDFQGEPPSTQPTIGGLPITTVAIIGAGALFALILGIVVGGKKK